VSHLYVHRPPCCNVHKTRSRLRSLGVGNASVGAENEEEVRAFVKVIPVSQTRVCTLHNIRRASDVLRISICLLRGSFAARRFENVDGPAFAVHCSAVNCSVSVTELKSPCGKVLLSRGCM